MNTPTIIIRTPRTIIPYRPLLDALSVCPPGDGIDAWSLMIVTPEHEFRLPLDHAVSTREEGRAVADDLHSTARALVDMWIETGKGAAVVWVGLMGGDVP